MNFIIKVICKMYEMKDVLKVFADQKDSIQLYIKINFSNITDALKLVTLVGFKL